ncbi:unnamed protein product [Calypogeia fissa]
MCANVSSYDRNGPDARYLPASLQLPSSHQRDNNNNNHADGHGNSSSRKRGHGNIISSVNEQSENGGGSASKRAVRNPEIMFRLLIPATKIGKVIGKQGSQIKILREKTGARIKIADPVSWLQTVEERVVLISSRDEPGEAPSAAEDALIRVATIMVEERSDGDRAASIGPQHHVAPNLTRLLIAGSQAGSLIGKQGATIKDVRETSGANVRILPPDQLPVCSSALENDRLVQIAGEISQVQKALEMIGAKLRENPPKEIVSIRTPFFLASNPQLIVPQAGLAGFANPGRFRGQGGLRGDPYSRLGGNSGPGSGFNGSDRPLPKVSTEIRILSALMGGVIGRGGANISQIRSISGASVKVSGQVDGTTERTISIEGTPDQVAAAQSLVQAYLNAQ